MITFAYPYLLWLLAAVPIVMALYFWARWARSCKLSKFGKPSNLSELAPLVSPYKPPIKLTLRCFALACIILALCRPWGGVSNQNTSRDGIEVILAVDASNSMLASATDNPEGIDRMRMAKLTLEKLIDHLGNDRVGLVVYAGDAYSLIPVTGDYVSAKMFLNSIDPSMIQHQGTNIGGAINLAAASFSENPNIGKAIVLLTDAEELENPNEVTKAVEDASKKKIQIDVIGVGATKPMPVPLSSGELIDSETGEPVATALNEDLALEIAKAGKGIYVNAANKNAISELDKKLNQLQKSNLESSFLAVHDELYLIFVWGAFVLIILDIFVLDSKFVWLDRFTFFRKEATK
ncbi:MAG: VWA domain-containing protein [Muribaculum sp.]|nr:VWA domain-containing protein [Muribaculum sp.]MCM1237195.1 VWA domain-containing protein [Ruminococcus flavefaciens]